MPPVGEHAALARPERFHQVEQGRRPAGSGAGTIPQRNRNRRTAVAFHELARHRPHQTGMPSAAAHHHHQLILAGNAAGLLHRLNEDLTAQGLGDLVRLCERARQPFDLPLAILKEEPQHRPRVPETAGGIEPRHQSLEQLIRGRLRHADRLAQPPQPRTGRPKNPRQSLRDHDTVVTDQGRVVSQRPQRGKIHHAIQAIRIIRVKRLNQLDGQSRAAESPPRSVAAMRVDKGQGCGEILHRHVMIEDDRLDPPPRELADLLALVGSAVHEDREARAQTAQARNQACGKPVAVRQAIGERHGHPCLRRCRRRGRQARASSPTPVRAWAGERCQGFKHDG